MRPEGGDTGEMTGAGWLNHLVSLFMNPAVALINVQHQHRFAAALLGILILLTLGSFFSASFNFERHSKTGLKIISAVSSDLAPLRLSNGKLSVNEDVTLPYTRVIEGWQIDYRPELPGNGKITETMVNSGCGNGFMLTSDNLLFWKKQGEDGIDIIQQELIKPKHFAMLEEALKESGTEEISKNLIMEKSRNLAPILWGCFFIASFLEFGGGILFSFMMMLFFSMAGRISRRCTAKDLLSISINLCFPPAVLAFVWHIVAPPDWNFRTLYFTAYVLYLIFVVLDVRRFRNRDNDEHQVQ